MPDPLNSGEIYLPYKLHLSGDNSEEYDFVYHPSADNFYIEFHAVDLETEDVEWDVYKRFSLTTADGQNVTDAIDGGAFDFGSESKFTLDFNNPAVLEDVAPGTDILLSYSSDLIDADDYNEPGRLKKVDGTNLESFEFSFQWDGYLGDEDLSDSSDNDGGNAPTLLADPIPSLNVDGQTISLEFSQSIDQASLQNALDNSNFQLFIDGEQRDDIESLSLESNDDSDDGESSASYSPDLEQLEFDIEEGISVDGFNDLSLEQLKDAFTFTSEGNPVDVTITNIELVDEENPNSFILTFDSADFENYINGPGLDIEFNNDNLGLKDVDDENLIGNQGHIVVLADDMDASGMAYDASGNSSSSSFTLRINGINSRVREKCSPCLPKRY